MDWEFIWFTSIQKTIHFLFHFKTCPFDEQNPLFESTKIEVRQQNTIINPILTKK